MNKTQWTNTHRLAFWLSFGVFFVGFVLFLVAYVGQDWYVVPPDGTHYPPDASSLPVKLGLFWMCVYGHCKYDLRVDYMAVQYIPYKPIQDAFQHYRTACMVIITIAMIITFIALGFNLAFLSRYSYSCLNVISFKSFFVGLAAGAAEMLAAIVALVGVSLFGNKFRGPTPQLPFGWSFWLMVAAMIILLLNGIIKVLLTLTMVIQEQRTRANDKSGLTRPLASGY